jgi:hypothetical protein
MNPRKILEAIFSVVRADIQWNALAAKPGGGWLRRLIHG